MGEALDRILQRGERLDTLNDKSEGLVMEADRCERCFGQAGFC